MHENETNKGVMTSTDMTLMNIRQFAQTLLVVQSIYFRNAEDHVGTTYSESSASQSQASNQPMLSNGW
jgi:hypothetical protein